MHCIQRSSFSQVCAVRRIALLCVSIAKSPCHWMWCMIDVRPKITELPTKLQWNRKVFNVWQKMPLSSACIIRQKTRGKPIQMDDANNLTFLAPVPPLSNMILRCTLALQNTNSLNIFNIDCCFTAVELAVVMNRLYGGVCYAGIDTDPELKYPKGAGRVAFSNQQSYIAAISARFVQLQHADIDKRVSALNFNISCFVTYSSMCYWSVQISYLYSAIIRLCFSIVPLSRKYYSTFANICMSSFLHAPQSDQVFTSTAQVCLECLNCLYHNCY